MAVHSQLIGCSASEVHAMVEGAMRHGTDMEIEANYVDSHGASFVGFCITRLLDFDLVARFKQINRMKLYVPGRGDEFSYPLLGPPPPSAAASVHQRDHPPRLRRHARSGPSPRETEFGLNVVENYNGVNDYITNMTPYGEIQLNLTKRLALSTIEAPAPTAKN